MPDLYDNLFPSPETVLRASGERDPQALIRSLLGRSGAASNSLGTPVSGLPISGMPTFGKAPILSTDFSQQPRGGPAPEMPLMPAPQPPEMRKLKVGAALGENAIEDALQRQPQQKKPDGENDEMKRIRDALAASQNALAALYGQPQPTSPQGTTAGSAPRKVYTPMQAPDTGEEVPPEMALEQYRYNLGNIRTSDNAWQGKTTPYRGFESFASPEQGARAMFLNLRSYTKNPDMTLGSAIAKWAPKSENDTEAYIASVAKNTGIPANTPLKDILSDPRKAAAMMYAMGQIEHGKDFLPVFTPEFLAKVVAGVQ